MTGGKGLVYKDLQTSGGDCFMPDGRYEQDSLAWAERQSDLLRRLAAGERVNEAVEWADVIEEIHDVGLSELL